MCILLAPFAPALQNQAPDRVIVHTQADDGTQGLQPEAWDNTQHHGYGSLLVTSWLLQGIHGGHGAWFESWDI